MIAFRVPLWLKGKSQKQKDDFSMMTIGRKYAQGIIETQGTKRPASVMMSKKAKKKQKKNNAKVNWKPFGMNKWWSQFNYFDAFVV